jgi:hypothetical protein
MVSKQSRAFTAEDIDRVIEGKQHVQVGTRAPSHGSPRRFTGVLGARHAQMTGQHGFRFG